MRRAALVLALCAACGEKPKPAEPAPGTATDAADTGQGSGLEPDRPAIEEVPQEERIAAIEHAMNALAPVANQCWAAAAADDFRLAGDVRALITIGPRAGAGAKVDLTANSTDDDVLGRCLREVLAAYPWAPPLAGQAIELPFHFDAPAMQNVIDRRFVPRKGQAGVTLAVLLDETNTGNRGLSLIELEAAAGATVAAREVERPEVWWIAGGAATVRTAGGADVTLVEDDLLVVPVGARIELVATKDGALRALVAIVPGGREGSARAGALPGKATTMAVRARPPQPVVRRGADVPQYDRPGGSSAIGIEPPLAGGKLSLSFLTLDAGSVVPAHVHAAETEALYVFAGGGTMTVAGVAVPVGDQSVVQVPPNVEHGFTAAAGVQTFAVQLYTPAGPEQRFKKPPAKRVPRRKPTPG